MMRLFVKAAFLHRNDYQVPITYATILFGSRAIPIMLIRALASRLRSPLVHRRDAKNDHPSDWILGTYMLLGTLPSNDILS
jgi:hypothetical protein